MAGRSRITIGLVLTACAVAPTAGATVGEGTARYWFEPDALRFSGGENVTVAIHFRAEVECAASDGGALPASATAPGRIHLHGQHHLAFGSNQGDFWNSHPRGFDPTWSLGPGTLSIYVIELDEHIAVWNEVLDETPRYGNLSWGYTHEVAGCSGMGYQLEEEGFDVLRIAVEARAKNLDGAGLPFPAFVLCLLAAVTFVAFRRMILRME